MSKQYGESNKAVGRKPSLDKHPGPKTEDKQHFSNMAVVDAKEHHLKAIKNMSEPAGHVKGIKISDHHSYKRQSHAARPSEIKSFVGNHLDTHASKDTKVVKPGSDGDYDND